MDSHSFNEYCYYVDSLISNFIGMSARTKQLSNEAKEFFLDIIHFPIITFDGEISRMKGKYLSDPRFLGVITSNWSRVFLPKMADYVLKENLNIIVLNEFSCEAFHMDKFVSRLFGVGHGIFLTDITLISPISGLHISVFDKDRSQDIIDNYDISNHIRSSLNATKKEVLCVPSRRGSYFSRFNRSHPLISPLFNKNEFKNKQAKSLLEELCNNFNSIMSTSVDRTQYLDLEWLKILNRGNHAEIAKGVFIRDPEIYIKFNQELVSFWSKLVKYDFINEMVQMPLVELEDFPWYYSSQKNYLDN